MTDQDNQKAKKYISSSSQHGHVNCEIQSLLLINELFNLKIYFPVNQRKDFQENRLHFGCHSWQLFCLKDKNNIKFEKS